MSININGKESFITDRTLISITQNCLDENDLYEFAINLKRLGVDFIEVDERTFDYLKPFIELEPYIFRVDNTNQLGICSANGIEYIIIKEENLELIKMEDKKKYYDFKIILEVDINLYKKNFMKKIRDSIDLNKVYAVRFKGESNCLFDNYMQDRKNIKIDMYASNKLFMATAVGVEALRRGFDFVTTTFCGKDDAFGTTALEEIITFETVIISAEVSGKISLLSQIAKQYEKLTATQISKNKPIIGKNIFKYESGVHAAGIEKNPITYEPFEPELVGMSRRLVLGKHSGKNSICFKLKELHIDNKFTEYEIACILNEVKDKSILNKMGISDTDFIDICKRIEIKYNV